MKGNNLIIAILLIALFSFRLWQTTGCRQFRSFYLNPQAITIRVEEDVNSDGGINRNLSRFFHNKLQTTAILTWHSLASELDARILLEILGPLGLLSTLISLHLIIKKKNLFRTAHLIILTLILLYAILTANAKQNFYLISLSLYSFSFWSAKTLSKYKILVVILAAITFWFFTLSWQLASFCHDIFFN